MTTSLSYATWSRKEPLELADASEGAPGQGRGKIRLLTRRPADLSD